MGVPVLSEEIRPILKYHVFGIFCTQMPIVRAHAFSTLTGSCGLMKGCHELKMPWNCYLKDEESITYEKTAFWCIMGCARAENARARVDARKIFKCLKWPETCSALEIRSFGAKKNFNARLLGIFPTPKIELFHFSDRAWYELSSHQIWFKNEL